MNGGNAAFQNKTLRGALNFYVVTIKRNRARICQEGSPRPAERVSEHVGPQASSALAPRRRARGQPDLDPGSRAGRSRVRGSGAAEQNSPGGLSTAKGPD